MHELLGAYALDAVDVDERAAFEAHLATCSACAQELDELRAMLADLAESTAVAPPPALRARVLQGVTPSGTDGPTGPVPPGAEPTALPDNVRALRPAPGPSRRLLLAAAAAAVVAGGGGTAGCCAALALSQSTFRRWRPLRRGTLSLAQASYTKTQLLHHLPLLLTHH